MMYSEKKRDESVGKQNRWWALFPIYVAALLGLTIVLVACGGGEETPAEIPTATPSSTTTTAPPPTDTPVVAQPAAPAEVSDQRTFVIDPTRSEARFILDEELMGAPKTVVGVTKLVNGSVSVGDDGTVAISPITVDARDLTTDKEFRNRAIRRFILESTNDAYRYITFQPTAVEGVPDDATVGKSFTFTITGDLTIRELTLPVIFSAVVTPTSQSEIVGAVATEVTRSQFELTIPQVPSVANVTDEVQLQLDFVAVVE